jgi:hypothetical protein
LPSGRVGQARGQGQGAELTVAVKE